MSVSAISSSSGYSPADSQSLFTKVKADFKSLATALQSGNLSDAQQAYATLQKDLPDQSQSSTTGSATNPLAAIGTALQSGDVTGAQQAFAALKQSHGGHHHHHSASSAAPSPVLPETSSDDTDDGTSQTLNAVA